MPKAFGAADGHGTTHQATARATHPDTMTHPIRARAPRPDQPPGASRGDRRPPDWTMLRWLFVFRLLLVVVLILVFSPAVMETMGARYDTELAWNVLAIYSLVVLLSGMGLRYHWPRLESQLHLATFVDILAFTLLMHAAGGVTSGLGTLLVVAVAAGTIMMEGRLSMLFAALASLGVITQQLYAVMLGNAQNVSFTQAGLLGLLIFAVALLSQVLYWRARSAEDLAARRQVDIDDLSLLNEFVIQSIGTGILVADGERHLRLMNQAALDLLRARRCLPGAALRELSPELGRWLEAQTLPSGLKTNLIRVQDREVRVSLKLLGDNRASGVIIYLRDNQEIAKEAQQIKLASLGTLTASIAHNIRNPLSAISHAGQLLAENPGLADDDRHLLDIIRRNSARIEETVHSVLQLSRRDQMESCQIDLSAWLSAFVAEFCENHGLTELDFALDLPDTPTPVETDPRQLHQILANLCENALIHAQRDGQPPRLLARLRRRQEHRLQTLLDIIDDGPGIDAAIVDEIFNPFFTTTSHGTGLGLYIARELAETNGVGLGYLPVEPHGSCFRLLFAG